MWKYIWIILFGIIEWSFPLNSFAQIQIGKIVTIESRFKGLPIVEPHLSVHPGDNDQLLVAAMIITDIQRPYQSARLSSFVSKDAGQTWQETAHDYWGYDPWTAILSNGQTAMSWLGTAGSFQHQFPVQFFSSDNGGETWSDAVQTFTNPMGHDGSKIATGNEGFYFTTVRFNSDHSADVVLYHRHDNGMFSEVDHIDAKGERLNFCEPVVLSDGEVLIPSSHFMRKAWVHSYVLENGISKNKHLITLHPGGGRGYMRMVVDRSPNSSFYNRVYFLRATAQSENGGGVWLNYSSDQGKTWSKDLRVDTFSMNTPSYAMLASAAVNCNGVIAISWMDSPNNSDGKQLDLYVTYSTDGGMHFEKPMLITPKSSLAQSDKNGDVANKFKGGGHYMHIADKPDGSFQLIWCDSASGIFELKTANIIIPFKG